MELKRKARSPCENKLKSFRDYTSPETSFESCESLEFSTESTEEMSRTRIITVRVVTRDGEPFLGALTRPQGLTLWVDGYKQPKEALYGISLCESKDKPFMFDFRLNVETSVERIPKTVEAKIGEHSYVFEYVPLVEFASIGDVASISIKRTRWKISLEQVNDWLIRYGEVVAFPDHVTALDCEGIKTDEIVAKVKLTKHIPSILPAYGLRVSLTYPGQPITCGKCYAAGHVRANCPQQNSSDFVRVHVRSFYEANVPSKLLGRWFDLLKALD